VRNTLSSPGHAVSRDNNNSRTTTAGVHMCARAKILFYGRFKKLCEPSSSLQITLSARSDDVNRIGSPSRSRDFPWRLRVSDFSQAFSPPLNEFRFNELRRTNQPSASTTVSNRREIITSINTSFLPSPANTKSFSRFLVHKGNKYERKKY